MIKELSQSEWVVDIQPLRHGWDNFKTNHGTDFAKDSDLILSQQELKAVYHKKNSIKSTRGLRRKIKMENFVESPWTKWYKRHTKLSSEYTINEYKSEFKRKRPNWAKSFAEKNVSKKVIINDKYKVAFAISKDLRSMKFWYIERELYSSDKKGKTKIVIERIVDAHGRCNRVTMIKLNTNGGPFKIQQEDKISKDVWISNMSFVYNNNWTSCKLNKFINAENPWAHYF